MDPFDEKYINIQLFMEYIKLKPHPLAVLLKPIQKTCNKICKKVSNGNNYVDHIQKNVYQIREQYGLSLFTIMYLTNIIYHYTHGYQLQFKIVYYDKKNKIIRYQRASFIQCTLHDIKKTDE